MKFYYIYRITNNLNNKVYIGKRTSKVPPDKDTNYLGSGKLIKRAIEKYGKENFTKEIVEICTKESLSNREKYYIEREHCRDLDIGYNIIEGGYGVGDLCSEYRTYYNKEKDIEIRLPKNEEPPEGYIYGRRPFTQETRNKCARKGLQNGMYGTHHSGEKNPFFGKKHSEKTKARLREINTGKRTIKNIATGELKVLKKGEPLPNGFAIVAKKERPKSTRTKDEVNKLLSDMKKELWKDIPEETCPYCGKIGRGAGFNRWHKKNCIHHPTLGETNKKKRTEFASKKSNELKGRTGTTTNKVCITDGVHNKFVDKDCINNYPGYYKGMTKKV